MTLTPLQEPNTCARCDVKFSHHEVLLVTVMFNISQHRSISTPPYDLTGTAAETGPQRKREISDQRGEKEKQIVLLSQSNAFRNDESKRLGHAVVFLHEPKPQLS